MKYLKTLLATSISLALLAGCGSDDFKIDQQQSEQTEQPQEPVNQAPSITLENAQGVEKQTITLTASVEDEGDVTYLWAQSDGIAVSLENTETDTVSFVAPSVTQDQSISLTLTVKDEQGLSATKDVDVEIKQQLVVLTVDGIATDSPLMEASVKATLGEHEFTTTTTTDGLYSLVIEVDDDIDMSQVVTIEAQGNNDQQAALLQSRLMSFATLKSRAGDDGVLSQADDFAVNVTNLTTAKAALMLRENAMSEIVTEQDLQRLGSEINADELIQVATAIKVILDKSSSNDALALPAGVDNVLELALDEQKITDYIAAVKDEPAFTQAKEEMLADDKVVDNSNISEINTLYLNEGIQYYNPVIEFNNDGQGHYTTYSNQGSFTWHKNNNVYTLENPDGIFNISSSEQVLIDGQQVYIDMESSVYKVEITLLTDAENGVILKEKQFSKVSYPNGEKPDYEDTSEFLTNAFTNNQQVDFALATTTPLAVPFPSVTYNNGEVETSLDAATLILDADGSGSLVELANTPLQWQLVESGGKKSLVITLTDYNNQSFTFRQLTSADGIVHIAAFNNDDAAKAFVHIASQIKSNEYFDIQTVPSVYAHTSGALSAFWFELWPDGRLITVSTYDYNNDAELSADEVGISRGNWSLQDGKVSLSRYTGGEGCYYADISPSCWEYNRREWRLIEQVNDSVYFTRKMMWAGLPNTGFTQVGYNNRKLIKQNDRPIQLPEETLQGIGQFPYVNLTGLVALNNYLEKPLYYVSYEYSSEGEVGYFQFNADQTFDYYQDGELSAGSYQAFADNQVILRDDTSFFYGKRYGLLAESNNVVIAAFDSFVWPHFGSEVDAKGYAEAVAQNTPVSGIDHLLEQKVYMVDRDQKGQWVMTFLKFGNGKITIYSDESFSSIETELAYTVTEEGVINLSNTENTMYLSLVTDAFNIIVTHDVENESKDFNYFLFDFNKAKDFINNSNALRESAYR
ncbi:PKD domain-containing protein [Pseudoalteromonas gelatinilytica]